jgi:hypothetical protein
VSDEIELISDGDGLAVLGDATAVDHFLSSYGLRSRDLELPRLSKVLSTGAGVADAASIIAATSGRWVQITAESADAMSKFSMMQGSASGLSRAVFTQDGKITGLMEIVHHGSVFANPAVLAGAAGIMAQIALQQAMQEITEYLAVIDAKVDDVLRAQKNAVLADMIGVGFVIEEAMTIRAEVGGVSDVTWSKVQGTALAIARTQAYALRHLDSLAEKMEATKDLGELRAIFKGGDETVGEWLAVLARCFQLQDALAILELDRVLTAAPDELNAHRIGVRVARQNRLDLIAQTTSQLMVRMDAAAGVADTKVLTNPIDSPAIVRISNRLALTVTDFQSRVGVERSFVSRDRTPWLAAAVDARDLAIETGFEGVEAAMRLGGETVERAKAASDKVAAEIAKRVAARKPKPPAGG